MSVSRPARCIFSATSTPKIRLRIRCQNFHSSPYLGDRRRPRFASLKASEMGLTTGNKPAQELFSQYTEDEKKILAAKYTPAQIQAIEAGEAAIDPEDLKEDGVIRTDMGRLHYLEDLSITRTVLDRGQSYQGPRDPQYRIMTEDEYNESYTKTLEETIEPPPKNPDGTTPPRMDPAMSYVEREKFITKVPKYMGPKGPNPIEMQNNYMAPGLPRYLDITGATSQGQKPAEDEEPDPRDPDGTYDRLIQQTDLTLDAISDFQIKILVQHRVVNQTRLGRIGSLYCLAVAGNRNGLLGIGEAKGQDWTNTMNIAKISAIKRMKPIPRYEDRTIFGEVDAKVSGVELKLMSRPPGFGLRCQHLIFEMARAAGIRDLSARIPRSRNKMNTCKAAYKALMNQRIPDEIARGRGKKLIDVRKVYYGGRV